MSRIKQFSVDKALDTIDYSFPNYTPSEDSLEFFNLMRLVQGADFEFRTPLSHYLIVDALFGHLKVKDLPYSQEVKDSITLNIKRIAVMASRGLAKSTVVTTFMPVYLAIKGKLPNYGKVYFMLGIAASAQGGGRVMCKAIQSLCQDSLFCNNYFETMRFTETESEMTRKGKGDLNSRTFLFRSMGFSGGIRGTRSNVGANRPDIVAFDDTILNTAAAYSKTQMDTLSTIMSSDAENSLKGGGNGRIWVVATPFNAGDPNYKLITSGAYTPIVLPMCEKIKESYKAKDIVSAWGDMHPAQAILDQYRQARAANSMQSFMQERMLRVSSEEDRMIPDYMIKWYDSRGTIIANIGNFNLLVTTDFTASNSLEGDFSGIALWAINQIDEKYLLDIWLEKATIQGQFDALFKMLEKWGKWTKGKTIDVGVEIDGQQQTNIFALDKMKIEKNVWFNYARQKGRGVGQTGIRSRAASGAKLDRFRAMLPEFEMGRIKFPSDLKETPAMEELMEEIKKASHGGLNALHDDGIDLISQVGLIDYFTPTGEENPQPIDRVDGKDSPMWEGFQDEDEGEKSPFIF